MQDWLRNESPNMSPHRSCPSVYRTYADAHIVLSEQMMQSLAHALMGHSLICYSCSPPQVTTSYQLDHGIKL